MHLLDKYRIPLFQAPDTPVQADPPPVDPPAPDVDALVAEPEPQPEPPPAVRMVSQETLINQVTPLRAKNRELEATAARYQREAEEARAMVERLSRKDGDPPPQAPRAEPQRSVSDQDVESRAAQLVFQREAQSVSQLGAKTYGAEWGDAVNFLEAVGLNNGEFVSAVMDVDRANTHQIMHAIAKNPEKAAALASMTPTQRIAEITRISDAMTTSPAGVAPAVPRLAAPTRVVSRAPAPPPPLEPSAQKVVDWRDDKASDAYFSEGWNETMKTRHRR